ncbi:MAG: hypothetical protein ACRDPF_28095 [Streptosporangiaceae bacterium]
MPTACTGGLVVSRAEGTRRVYQLNPDGVSALRAYLDRVWDEALSSFDSWWPREYHFGQAEMAEAILEEHRYLDRLASGDAIRGMIQSGGGWIAILELFAKAAQ